MKFDTDFQVTFLGQCFGVGLNPRSEDDPTVVATILVEDDGNWFEVQEPHFDAGWLEDIAIALDQARIYCQQHCIKIPEGGYTFKNNNPTKQNPSRTRLKRFMK